MHYINFLKSLLCFSISIFFAVALISYNYADPSLDNATNVEPQNIAGFPGAYVADPILQLFGLSSLIIILTPMCWAYVYFYYGKVSFWFLRILAGIVALNAASLLFNGLQFNSDYFSYTGGAIGVLWQAKLSLYFTNYVIKIAAASILAVSLYLCLALNNSNWARFIKIVGALLSYSISSLARAFQVLLKKFKSTSVNEYIKESPKIATRVAPVLSENRAQATNINQLSIQEQPKTQIYEVPIVPRKIIEKAKPSYEQVSVGGFVLPSTSLLKEFPVNKDNIEQNNSVIKQHTEELLQVLSDFGVMGEITGAASGPVVTLYELEPAAGTKSSRIIGLSDDISRSMRSTSARIAVIPGRNAIGIELPNSKRETVYLKELLESAEYQNKDYDLPIILGKDISGNVIVADLARMPHLLVAGTTGSGKSVAINTMILSLVYALTPDQCKFIMVDPKMLELSVYDGIPHLLTNVVTEPGKAVVALKWVVKEMENRYRLMSNLGVRSVHNYNDRIKDALANGEIMKRTVQTGFDPETGQPKIEQVPLDMKILPFIVVIVDEMADLMLVAGKDIETSIQRLAQMARAAGIHIIMATQRPSVDVITGVIKANFPTRISFQVTSKIDSRTILGEQGAEQLLGKGDMLYMAGGSKITRIHGPFVADDEVERIVSYLKSQGQPDYMSDITSEDSSYTSSSSSGGAEMDELYKQAVEIVAQEGKASTSFIQRCLKIGYNRAANIMEQMERDGLVGKPNHVGKREILM